MTAVQNFRVASFVAGLAIKAPCSVASIAPLVLQGLQTVDTVVLAEFDRILVKDQVDPIENGLYSVRQSAWVRDGDFDGSRDIVGGTIIPVYRPSDGEIVLYNIDGAPTKLTPDTDALSFSVYFDSAALGAGGLTIIQKIDETLSAGNTFTSTAFNVAAGDVIIFDITFTKGNGDQVLLDFNLGGTLTITNVGLSDNAGTSTFGRIQGSLTVRANGDYLFSVNGEFLDGSTVARGFDADSNSGIVGSEATSIQISETAFTDDYELTGYIARVN